jgi:hypothetical protein
MLFGISDLKQAYYADYRKMDKTLSAYRELGLKRYRETSGLYYEDFEIGDVFEHRPGRTITDVDITDSLDLFPASSILPMISSFSIISPGKRPSIRQPVRCSS